MTVADSTRADAHSSSPAGEWTSTRAELWESTMAGHASSSGIRVPHAGGDSVRIDVSPLRREEREEAESAGLARGATRSAGSGRRAIPEEPDEWRTCFERDRDRILHSAAFRRLAGKTQVFVFPADHQRTRLTHAIEVAQVASAIARACRLNVALVEGIALGHDCGHGPGGHASEDAMRLFVPDFDHAVWGADVTAAPLNLCVETLDGIRNHSWSRPSPSTPEGQVVGLADRIAYCAHDLEDAVHAGIVSPSSLPDDVVAVCGTRRSDQLRAFISDAVATITTTGVVGLSNRGADALGNLRRFNHEHIYLRDESVAQADAVVAMLRALVEHYSVHPTDLPPELGGSGDALEMSVAYVAGMTDRFACDQAQAMLGWPPERLPRSQYRD